MNGLTESTLEQAALDWFESLGWQLAFGPNIKGSEEKRLLDAMLLAVPR